MVKENQHKIQKKDNKNKNKKEMINNDSDDSDDCSYRESDESEEEMDNLEYKKLLAKLFPSKYMNKKVKSEEKFKRVYKKYEETQSDEETESE